MTLKLSPFILTESWKLNEASARPAPRHPVLAHSEPLSATAAIEQVRAAAAEMRGNPPLPQCHPRQHRELVPIAKNRILSNQEHGSFASLFSVTGIKPHLSSVLPPRYQAASAASEEPALFAAAKPLAASSPDSSLGSTPASSAAPSPHSPPPLHSPSSSPLMLATLLPHVAAHQQPAAESPSQQSLPWPAEPLSSPLSDELLAAHFAAPRIITPVPGKAPKANTSTAFATLLPLPPSVRPLFSASSYAAFTGGSAGGPVVKTAFSFDEMKALWELKISPLISYWNQAALVLQLDPARHHRPNFTHPDHNVLWNGYQIFLESRTAAVVKSEWDPKNIPQSLLASLSQAPTLAGYWRG